MKWKRAVAVLLLCGLLQGCGLAPSFADPERSAGKIVLQVSVEAMPADTAWDRVYTEPVKIEAILDYIQALHTVPPETGEQEVKEEATCKITLHYSAGAGLLYGGGVLPAGGRGKLDAPGGPSGDKPAGDSPGKSKRFDASLYTWRKRWA